MHRIGLLYRDGLSDAAEMAERLASLLTKHGLTVWRGGLDDESGLISAAPDLDLLVTLGGDGTIVRAIRSISQHGVPILGVNLGRLGFLAEVEPEQVEAALPALVSGQYQIEERMILSVEVERAGEILLHTDAVNEVVMARGLVSRTVHIEVNVDGHHVFTPSCDGIIVATPTGSTAYCLAAGGHRGSGPAFDHHGANRRASGYRTRAGDTSQPKAVPDAHQRGSRGHHRGWSDRSTSAAR